MDFLRTSRHLIIILCFVIGYQGSIQVQAQFSQPAITFESLNHNFGVIMEADGIVQHTFVFTNTGSEPLVIADVRSTCGCTIPEWSKEPIMPMKKGSIKVSFDPVNRPGAFRKEIIIMSNARDPKTTLYIVGLVKAKTLTVYDEYPIQMDGVRFKSNHMSVARISKGETLTDTMRIYNAADISKIITIPEAPEHLKFEIMPAKILPGQKGEIVVHYDADKKNDWGFVMDKVYLHFNGVRYENNLLAVSATIEDNFSSLSPDQLSKAPKMEFDEDAFNFGTIKQREVIRHVFNFKNSGQEKLIIRKISSTCGCTASEPSSWEIGPGEKGTLTIIFDSTGKIGKQLQTVTLITNDPHQPTKMLRMIGTVQN